MGYGIIHLNVKVEYQEGRKNVIADALSRLETSDKPKETINIIYKNKL